MLRIAVKKNEIVVLTIEGKRVEFYVGEYTGSIQCFFKAPKEVRIRRLKLEENTKGKEESQGEIK